ncbi:MAG: zinc ribbon domain-containing protein [Haloarculaceae archaeon]
MKQDLHFRCSRCGATIEVNREMREALLEDGCVVCGAGVLESDFS